MGGAEETQGERLVRIEVLLGTMKDALVAHIQDEELDLKETRQLVQDHIRSTGSVGEDLRAMRKDMHDMQKRMETLEIEVRELTKNKTMLMAWAAGAGSVITLIGTLGAWIMSKFL